MALLRLASLVLITLFLSGCSITYLVKSGMGQLSILTSRTPITKAIKDPKLSPKQVAKLELTLKAKEFAQKQLALKPSKSFSSFVHLDRDYVTYLLRVSPAYEFKSYTWSFPFAGKFPYKGFFNLKDAQEEAKEFPPDKFDTYIRGVTAYSTLGWFNDPLLSSMLRYKDFDLVSTIIHEMIHETLFIKDNTSFNEKLANFLGDKGAEIYYQKQNTGEELLTSIKLESEDKKLFSAFISKEIQELKKWYKTTKNLSPELKAKRLKMIQTNFSKNLKPKLKTNYHSYFLKLSLNNARLLPYDTYVKDMSAFEEIYKIHNKNFAETIAYFKTLERSKDPEQDMKSKIEEHYEKNN